MAEAIVRDSAPAAERELLAFRVGEDAYAVELSKITEIVVPPPITKVPRSPAAVIGVSSVRGQLVTVIDLRKVLDYPPLAQPRRGRLLIGYGPDDELMSLWVDEVRQVVRLPAHLMEWISSGGESGELVRGIGRPPGEEALALLDLKAVFAKGAR